MSGKGRAEQLQDALTFALAQAFSKLTAEEFVAKFPRALKSSSSTVRFLSHLHDSVHPLVAANCQAELRVILKEMKLEDKLAELDDYAEMPHKSEVASVEWQEQETSLAPHEMARLRRIQAKLRELAELDRVISEESRAADELEVDLAHAKETMAKLEQAIESSQAFVDDLAASVASLASTNEIALSIMADMEVIPSPPASSRATTSA
ncbi:uncharacterized protein AMSG_06228 [Thecamonas trahens ATCC 50062]|uniref:Uncharacterized protein n=1 Tax=Thecamonas trahens ATCC 50062 TaxID=461836 RepID=A0A0L0DF29_THETB|nr:hypothetical protein AMSG_06228 [Thecamonas trahens ATCC 50062]KNC49923.1 hypothetical protein AMSG_06228 [Thecamonas trahens ATCC 50062]|eukprot:XP_013757402.1 hypothetical protein AMSG_06228 [Thecamonas trahens ATCC 50062]